MQSKCQVAQCFCVDKIILIIFDETFKNKLNYDIRTTEKFT